MAPKLTAEEIIACLGLEPHPEGGYYRQTFCDSSGAQDGRPASTLIYFLLCAGQDSAWHRIDSAEVWHYYAGAPLLLSVADNGQTTSQRLGPDLPEGERPQAVVPPMAWQSARTLGAWTLVGCTVAPGFSFAHFELAPDGWTP